MQSPLGDYCHIKDGMLYYYLPLSTFVQHVLSISHTNFLILKLSHIEQLADTSEFYLGQSIIETNPFIDGAFPLTNDIIKKKLPLQISFSHSKDCFPMWEIYGKKKHVNDTEIPSCGVMLAFSRIGLEKYLCGIHPLTTICDCIYSGTKKYNEIKKLFTTGQLTDDKGIPINAESNYLIHRFPFLAKDGHYKYEKERRAINIPQQDSEQRVFEQNGAYYIKIPKTILKYVMIFPISVEKERVQSYNLVKDAMELCFNEKIPNSKIIFSKILVRE